MFPRVRLERDPIYVRDGNLWSSAGVTAGMDLALALVEEDLGRDVALETARGLVLFLRRPGGQSQFSAQLAVQASDRQPLRSSARGSSTIRTRTSRSTPRPSRRDEPAPLRARLR
jgi:transcriptional regulator GlxA family with amidase domain